MKKQFTLILILVIVVSFLAQLLFGPYISARLATWPQLQRLGIIRPQAPIVITNQETVRVSDSQDAADAVSRAKSRLASISVLQNGTLVRTGGAVSLTSDGLFLTVAGAFPIKGASYSIILNDGRVAPISALVSDPATSLVIITTSLGSVSVSPFATSRDLSAGQKIGFVTNGSASFNASFRQSYVVDTQIDNAGIYNADHPTRVFDVQPVGALTPGEAVIAMGGDVAGMWDGTKIISSDVIHATTDLYFGGNNKVNRPSWGFSYRPIMASESNAINIPQGARVTKPDVASPAVIIGSPAQVAGLQEGDIIIEANGVRIGENVGLEEQLQKFHSGDTVSFNVVRAGQTVSLKLTVGQLK